MLTNSYEDFVMTPIKCPPPKIVAVKRSLKRPKKQSQNIMDDDEELSSKEDFINDDDSLSSFDAKDLIEFERDEPLIDLSDSVENSISQDTVSDKNAKNSTTLLSLLEMLEIGNITRATEMKRVPSCAEIEIPPKLPFVAKESSSSSSPTLPVECPSACATSSGKTDKLSTVFPPLSIQPENSLAKNVAGQCRDSNSELKETLKSPEGEECESEKGIEVKFIDSTLRKSPSENFASTLIDFSRSESSIFGESPLKLGKKFARNFEKLARNFEEFSKESLKSDTNNNHESVCNQNSEKSTTLTKENECFEFLSPHTSQRKLPPKFYSSTNSLNQDCFEASSRLKRLEERFKGFSYTKKLLRSSKVFSKSEEILSSYGKASEFKPLNSLSSSTLSENCLRQLTVEDSTEDSERKTQASERNDEISGEFFAFFSIKKSSLALPSVIIEEQSSKGKEADSYQMIFY